MKKINSFLLSAVILGSTVSCSSSPKVSISDSISPEPQTQQSEEQKSPVVITYAVAGTTSKEEQRVIDKFNEADNGYLVEVREYSEFFDEIMDGNFVTITDENRRAFNINVTQDIKNGKIDVVRDIHLCSSATYDILAKRGYFTDLYPFLDSDSDVNKSTLNEHIIELHDTDGHLFSLPTMFKIETMVGQSRYVGEKENWSVDEMISYWEKMPEGSKISGHAEKDYVYMTILRHSLDSFTDYKNNIVSFDSPEFRKLLEFCNSFNSSPSYYNEYDYEAINFVGEKYITGFNDFHGDVLYNPENEPVTFVGYPAENGGFISTIGERFSICETGSDEKKLGAWEFIKMFAMEDYQTDCGYTTEKRNVDGTMQTIYIGQNSFPVNNKIYNEFAENTINGVYGDVRIAGYDDHIGSLTYDELERLNNYINSIDRLLSCMDRDLWNIVNDEIMAYFHDEKGIDDTISNIQNRAEIMVSEKQ